MELVPLASEKVGYRSGTSDESDLNGDFSISPVPAGKYMLSINYDSNPEPNRPFPTAFYPVGDDRSKAQIIEVSFGVNIDGLLWRLPPRLIEKEITGKVVWESGSPVAGAEIKLFDMAHSGFYAGCYLSEVREQQEPPDSPVRSVGFNLTGSTCNLKSDSNGEFRLSVYSGRTYRLSASMERVASGGKTEFQANSKPFTLDSEPPNIKLILKKK